MFEKEQTREMDATLKKAEEFHGHLGPFLALGVRMGLIGARELQAKGREEKLHVTAMLKYSVPFSCVIDGIQVATKCTTGNKRLIVKNDSSRIAAKIQLENEEKEVNILVDPAAFEELKTQLLAEDLSAEGIKRLAHVVASMPEEKLFKIRRT